MCIRCKLTSIVLSVRMKGGIRYIVQCTSTSRLFRSNSLNYGNVQSTQPQPHALQEEEAEAQSAPIGAPRRRARRAVRRRRRLWRWCLWWARRPCARAGAPHAAHWRASSSGSPPAAARAPRSCSAHAHAQCSQCTSRTGRVKREKSTLVTG